MEEGNATNDNAPQVSNGGARADLPKKSALPMSRRTLCLGLGGTAALFGLGGLKYIGSTPLLRPPGGQDGDRLISACIRCEKCYEVCPRHVIAPAHIESGIVNMRTPTLNFSTSYCDWCQEEHGGYPLCVKTCPTEALHLPEQANAQTTVIGRAVINTDWCLAYKLAGCRFCFDACPYEAMVLDENERPLILTDACNGCGACESACVSLQNGSITQGATARAIIIQPLEER